VENQKIGMVFTGMNLPDDPAYAGMVITKNDE
jgi:hypothetical protein